MTAKEMFKELGYRYLYLAGDIIYTNGTNRITFIKEYYDVSLENINLLQVNLVKAIHQQIKELGWESDGNE